MNQARALVLVALLPALAVASERLLPQRVVQGQTIVSKSDTPIRIEVTGSFKYVGGQRFILRQTTDAEQHFFVEADDRKTVQRLYWIQFEHFLPERDGEYSYDRDEPLTLGELGFRVHVRRYAEPPASDSDRGAAYAYLERAGYVVPTLATRVRLVHVPPENRRQEVMIVYVEASTTSGEPDDAEAASIVERARAGLSIAPR